ncbi:MAG: phage major capsid protein [Mycobacterium sp.]|nr:phage major capsid protein [Mycobacterium sp.]
MRAAHEKVIRQEPAHLESRASNTASPLLPGDLFPQPTFPIHEGRIADYLAVFAVAVPSTEYIQVNSVTGAAAAVAEAALKPEITLNVTKLTATVVKIAAHLGLTWESVQDFDAFTSAATTELQRLITDKENAFILAWLNVAGILTHAAVNTPTFDDLEEAISKLRVGPSLAVANLLVVSPSTWSAIRREKDGMERYYVAPDPSVAEVNSAWGVPVVSTTACPDGEGWLLDTTRLVGCWSVSLWVFGSASPTTTSSRTSFATCARSAACWAVERPSAVLHLTGLAPVTATARSGASSKSSTEK